MNMEADDDYLVGTVVAGDHLTWHHHTWREHVEVQKVETDFDNVIWVLLTGRRPPRWERLDDVRRHCSRDSGREKREER